MRLVTFNILHGRSPVDDTVDVDRFAAVVRDLDADILALQEVDRDQPRSHLADLTAVAVKAMGAKTHLFAAAVSGTPGATWTAATGREQPGRPLYGIALLSRYPARNWQVVRLPHIRVRFPMCVPGQGRVMIMREEPRVAVVGQFDTPLGRLSVANTHLSFVPGWNRVQLRGLRRFLSAASAPLVLLGDLNMRPPVPGFRSLAAELTFPAYAPVRQIDHVLSREFDVVVEGTSAPEVEVSDHRPLVVDVSARRSAQSRSG